MPGAVTVGELAVELELQNREFNRKMKDSTKRIDRFEKEAKQSTASAGRSFKSLLGPIAAIAAALGGLAALRVFGRISTQAVQGAAAFEAYEVRLKGLLNSQEAANKALESFVEISTKTPFAVSQIVGGAATLASVVGGSREELEELTQVTANLAAVTGLSFEEAAGNLQRALAGGISAAVLFRERGVTKLIEDINGIPSLTALSLEEQREAFKKTFGSDALAPFGSAAEDLSKTLSGALSNIGDASDNASRALGAAFAPAVFGAARGVAIPFFQEIEAVLIDNKDAITDFVVTGVAGLVRGFAKVLDVGSFILSLLGSLKIDFSDIGDIITILWQSFRIFFNSVRLGVTTLVTAVSLLAEGIGYVGNALGLVTDEEVDLLRKFRADSFVKLTEDAKGFGDETAEAMSKGADAMIALADDGANVTLALKDGADWARKGADELERQAEAFREMREEQAGASDELAAAAARRRSDMEAEIALMKEEFEELDREHRAWELAGGDVGAALPSMTRGEVDDFIEGLNEEFAALDEEHIQWLRDHGMRASGEITGILGTAFDDVLSDVARGEGVQNFGEILADTSARLLEASLNEVLSGAFRGGEGGGFLSGLFGGGGEDGGGLLSRLFGGEGGGRGLGGAEGGGGADWGAGASAALGLGGSLLAGALRGTETQVQRDFARSAVTSTQEVRGLVAGPSSIPIAQVGNAIRDSQGEQISELKRGNALLSSILDAIRAGGAAVGEAGDNFSELITSDMNGSVALG